MAEFTDMWDGKQGKIKAVKNQIEFYSPESKSVHSTPYRAESIARKWEKKEMEKMLSLGVIKPAQIEW